MIVRTLINLTSVKKFFFVCFYFLDDTYQCYYLKIYIIYINLFFSGNLNLDLNEESEPVYTFTLKATDHGHTQLSTETTLHLKIERVNEYSPVFTEESKDIKVNIKENILTGTVIKKV